MKVVCYSKLVSCSLFDIFSANSSELFSLTIYGNSAMIIVYALIGIRLWIGLNPLVTGTEEGEMAPAITSLQINYFKFVLELTLVPLIGAGQKFLENFRVQLPVWSLM